MKSSTSRPGGSKDGRTAVEDPFEIGGLRRLVLLLPAMVQCVMGALMLWFASETYNPWIEQLLGLLVLTGAIGILLSRGIFLRVALAVAALGWALPLLILTFAPQVDRHTAAIPGIGLFDSEGVGLLWLFRWLELPLWGIYAVLVAARLRRRRQTAREAASSSG